MKEVYDLQRAKNHFKDNTESVICKRGNQEFIARYYAEAEEFYRSDMKSPEALIMKEIIRLESDIKECKEKISIIPFLSPHVIENLAKVKGITPEQCKEVWELKIKKIQEEIQTLVKNNPDIEPYYMMHQICK